jgi:U3 small nucleolar RNA-associated protein MPP10
MNLTCVYVFIEFSSSRVIIVYQESKKPQPKTKSVGSKKVANVDLESDDGADESDLDSDAEAQLRAELEAELEEELAEEANGSDDEQSNEEDESEQDVEDDSQLDDSEGMDEEPSNEAESESEHDQSDQEDQSAGDGDSEDENTEAFFARANESKSDYKVSRERFFSASKFEHMMDDLEETDGLDFEVDLNSADAGDDEEEEEEEEEEAAPKRRKTNIAASQKADADAKYSDFFDAPPPQDEVSSDDEAEQADETEEVAGPQSEYEKFMAKMKADIGELEAEAVAPKQWHMAGEASARQRPESALLETHLEFETAAKVAPPITEESTAELETLIKRRCRDMVTLFFHIV